MIAAPLREPRWQTTADTTDKTEDPTQETLDHALMRGDVVKSQEVNTWFIIAGGTLVLMSFAGSMSEGLVTKTLRGLIANSYRINMDGRGAPPLVREDRRRVDRGAGAAIPDAARWRPSSPIMIQHQLVWTTEGAQRRSSPKSRRLPASSGCFPSRRWPTSPRASPSWSCSAAIIGGTDVAGTRPHGRAGHAPTRSRCCRSRHVLALEDDGGGRGATRRGGGGGLLVPVPDLVRATEDVAAGDSRRSSSRPKAIRSSRANCASCACSARASA